jgi:excinuclease UvrABC nuclease subunit
MNKASIDPLKLPKILLSQRKNLPTVCAIYFVLHENEIVYIGKANSLKHRWESHHRLKEFKKMSGDIHIAWLICDSLQFLDEIERLMIAQFKPRINGSSVEYATPRTTIYLEPELMEALEERAKQEKRTVSNMCNLLLEQAMSEWLKQKEK